MADNTTLNTGSGGDTIATDDISGVKFQRVKLVHGADGVNDGDVARSSPLPVDIEGLESPQRAHTSSATVAAGSSVDLDSSQITASKTGKLVAVRFGGTTALKAEIKTVADGVGSSVKDFGFSWPGRAELLSMPRKDFITQAYSATAGLDGFRATITNLDTSQAADVYATFYWDETA